MSNLILQIKYEEKNVIVPIILLFVIKKEKCYNIMQVSITNWKLKLTIGTLRGCPTYVNC